MAGPPQNLLHYFNRVRIFPEAVDVAVGGSVKCSRFLHLHPEDYFVVGVDWSGVGALD